MAYIGRPLQGANLAVMSAVGNGSSTTPIATLDYATTTNGIAVYLDGVRQLPSVDYNVTNQTTLTFTTPPANGVGIDVYFLGLEVSIPTPADGTISTAKLVDNSVTLAKMAGGTDGQVITYDASGDPVAVGPGTDGQVLTSTGAGSPPAFEAIPASGAWAVKTSGTVSSVANLDITGISKWTQIRLFNMRLTSGSGDVFFRTSSDNGSSFDSGASDYDYSRDQIGFQGRTQNANSVNTSGQPYSSTTEDDCMIIVDIPNPTGTSYTIFKWQMIHADGGDTAPTLYRFGMGIRASSADVDAFQIGVTSGAFSASYIVTELN